MSTFDHWAILRAGLVAARDSRSSHPDSQYVAGMRDGLQVAIDALDAEVRVMGAEIQDTDNNKGAIE